MNNQKQYLILLDINAGTEQFIKDYIALGYIIHQIVPFESLNKLLIIYYIPQEDEEN